MKVYMVTSGCYSDYSVKCICSTRAKAEHAKKLYAADNEISEVEVDELPEHPAGMFLFNVRMDESGDAESVETASVEYVPNFDWSPYGDGRTVQFCMFAKHEKHAVKIANERRVQLIASAEWTVDWSVWRSRDYPPNKVVKDG